jgi:dihydrofolate reductase
VILSLIVAMDENCGIGKDNRIPWHLSSDLKRFKKLTMGHHLVMGRKTYEAIGKPLPGRMMIVITRSKKFAPYGCQVVDSIDTAIQFAQNRNEDELFIIGGGEVFSQTIDIADKIYLTRVHAKVDADVFFPWIDKSEWLLDECENKAADEKDEYSSDFEILIRKPGKQVDKSRNPHIIGQTS